MDSDPNQLSFRNYPIASIIFGIISIGSGIYFRAQRESWTALAIALAIGLSLFLLASVLDVNADRTTRTLTVSRRGLIQRYYEEIPFSEIATIQLGSRRNTDDDGRTSTSYRVEIALKDGNVIPFRKTYSSGRRSKEKQAQSLREFIGVGGTDSSFSGMFKAAAQMAQPKFQAEQESITGDQDEIHETNGVRWQIETISFGNMPLLRWTSTDIALSQSFIYLTQKLEGQNALSSKKIMQPINNLLFKQSLQLYGFSAEYTPDINTAQVIDLPADFAAHFMAYTDEPARALQTLNAWTILPLTRWAKEHPLTRENMSEQLTILLGPQGLTMTLPGLMHAEFLDKFAELGAELVRAQGGGK